MVRGSRFLPLFAACALATFVAGPALADENGLKVGTGRVHPFFDLESRFDSAAGIVQQNGGGAFALTPDLLFHFKPGLKLEVPASNVQLTLNGALDYVLYSGVVATGTRSNNRLQGNADLDLGINRNGFLGLDLGDTLVRSDRTVTATVAVGVLSLYNDARVAVPIRPAGGALEFVPNYHLATELFSPFASFRTGACPAGDPTCDPAQVGQLNYLNHTPGLSARWKFLPKTAAVFDGQFIARQYLGGGGTPTLNMKAQVGLAGLLTTHLTTLLKVGWGQDFTTNLYRSVIGQAELGYLLSETGSVRGGYIRTFEPVGGRQFVNYGDDRAYLDARFLFGGKFATHATGTYDFLTFRGASSEAAHNIAIDVGGDYEFKPWFGAGLGYLLSDRISPAQIGYAGKTNFMRHEVYARLHFIY